MVVRLVVPFSAVSGKSSSSSTAMPLDASGAVDARGFGPATTTLSRSMSWPARKEKKPRKIIRASKDDYEQDLCVDESLARAGHSSGKYLKDTITANGLVPVRMPLAIRAVRGHVTIIL